MRRKTFVQKYSRKAFTLSEVLIVIAIIAVLSSLAFPAIIRAQKRLEMLKLNDTAKELFMAAQNELTARKSAGTVSEISPEAGEQWICSEGAVYSAGRSYTGNMELLVPEGSVAVDGGEYAIRYNADTATVIDVLYSEKTSFSSLDPVDYVDADGVSNLPGREEKRIGYYSGADIDVQRIEYLPKPSVSFSNGEVLLLNVKNLSDKSGTMEILLSDGISDVIVDTVPVLPGELKVYTIDSLAANSHFRERFSTLTPGADITATAVFSVPSTGAVTYVSGSAKATDNSLFASVFGDTAEILCCRHLQNLESSVSGARENVRKAVQKADIDWADTRGPADFIPVNSTENHIISYDGSEFVIRNLKIDSTAAGFSGSSSIGLFAAVSGTLTDIRLCDPTVVGRSTDSVGILAGTAVNAAVSGCQVYASEIESFSASGMASSLTATVTGGANTGGLIGRLNGGSVTSCSASLQQIAGSSSGNAGGLVGSAEGSIASSYADTGYRRNDDSGEWGTGLSGGYAGGLIGSSAGAGVSVSSCYASGYIGSSTVAAGLAARHVGSSDSIASSYSIVKFGENAGNSGVYTYSLSPISGYTRTNCYFWTGSGAKNDIENSAGVKVGKSLEELKAISAGGASALLPAMTPSQATYPYNANVCSTLYPFPMFSSWTLPHYGDWPMENQGEILAFYTKTGGNPLDLLLVPAGKSVTVYVETPGNVKPTLKGTSNISDISAANSSLDYTVADLDGTRFPMTVTNTNFRKLGPFGIDLTAGTNKLRVIGVVFKADITLSCGSVSNTGSSSAAPVQQTVRTLTIPGGNDAVCTASMTLIPDKQTLTTKMNTVRANSTDMPVSIGGTGNVTDTELHWDDFSVIRTDATVSSQGPGVSDNKIIDPINRIYPVIRKNDAERERFPYVAGGMTVTTTNNSTYKSDQDNISGGSMTITGYSAGTAEVSVGWYPRPDIYVVCPIEVTGPRAYINTAVVKGNSTGDSWSASPNSLPYKVFAAPLAGETVRIELTPVRYGILPSGRSERFTWTLTDRSGNVLASTVTNSNTQTATLNIADTPSDMLYRVTLRYDYGTGSGSSFVSEYTAADFMRVSVVRRAGTSAGTGLQPIILSSDSLALEQVAGNAAYNVKTICGRVNGADDSQLLWYLDVNGNGSIDAADTLLSGLSSGEKAPVSVTVNGKSVVIANVEWLDQESDAGGAPSRGGTVKITANDVSYYDAAALSFRLIAKARNDSDPDDYAMKSVTVNVMPKLQISPRTVMTRSGSSWQKTFTANRDPVSGYTYAWSLDNKTSTNYQNSNLPTNKTLGLYITSPETLREITLNWGPHTATAIMGTVGTNQLGGDNNTIGAMNYDGETSGKKYFIIEKKADRDMTFSWFTVATTDLRQSYLKTEPSLSSDIYTMSLLPGSTGTGTGNRTKEGNRYYSVNGKNFGTANLKWFVQQQTLIFGWFDSGSDEQNCDLSVVGTEFSVPSPGADAAYDAASNTLTIKDLGKTSSVDLTSYFPAAVATGTISISSSNSDVVTLGASSFSPAGNAVSTEHISLTSARYGVTTLTAEYSLNGRADVYRDTIIVKVVPPDGSPIAARLEPYTGSDLASIFGADYEPSTRVFDDSGNPLLFSDFADGYDVMYFKSFISEAGTPDMPLSVGMLVSGADLKFLSSNPNAVQCSYKQSGNTYYLKVKARSGSARGENIVISANYGTIPEVSYSLTAYSRPSIRLTSGGADVTDRHSIIYQNRTSSEYSYEASLVPVVCTYEGGAYVPVSAAYQWTLEFPSDGYDDYLGIESVSGNSAAVGFYKNPLCKVIIEVRSVPEAAASVAHALVFIPQDQ